MTKMRSGRNRYREAEWLPWNELLSSGAVSQGPSMNLGACGTLPRRVMGHAVDGRELGWGHMDGGRPVRLGIQYGGPTYR